MAGQTEDVPYNVSAHATAEPEKEQDPDQPNKGILLDCIKYLDGQIKKHNSLDVIKPDAEKIMTTQQQVLVHQEVTTHLRGIRTMLKDKAKELQ